MKVMLITLNSSDSVLIPASYVELCCVVLYLELCFENVFVDN